MTRLWNNHRTGVLIGLAVLLILFFASAFVVGEEEQAVVIRTGNPVGTVNTPGGDVGAGLRFKVPFIESVRMVDKRLLDLEMTDEEVLSNDQQRLLVNAYARFRIVDPVRMVERAGTTDGVRVALEPILNSVLRQELGRRTFQAMLTAERGSALANVRANLDRQARQYGAQVVDVQIKRTDLPDGAPLQSAFRRMESDREREARTIRAQGGRDARIIRAEADAESARIYAEAFGKDASFYDFYRAMQSYDSTFSAAREGEGPKGDSSIILSPDNEYLRQFRGQR
ncbi:protease modulator HflC [Qipengyuania pelagi]|jgi:membrane protease subunit HflC|uniref:Protein HflC n=1 Tax=Qipengyuania pelagi TaxID=994320 RepID=A0A844Y8G2_9SPHN|nr:protease modulator HflC [Qipengyuania pelagi]MEC7817464.1 protease modulator HflC [Pseudomonadota bacterium]MXO54415.1 protease modulator HflC [Qipengyuania pelagi]